MDLRFTTKIVDVSVAMRALQLYRDKNYKQAIEALLVILDSEPQNHDARLMLAASYFGTQQYAAAERSFRQVLDKSDNEELRSRAREGLQASLAKFQPTQSIPNAML